jgi:DNA phosphorothioation-dependent restriction protein DptG
MKPSIINHHTMNNLADILECPICLTDIEKANIATLDCCVHMFCKDCLLHHIKCSSRCPLCRKMAIAYHCDYITHNIITEECSSSPPVEDAYDQYMREIYEIECYLHANQTLYFSVVFSACITTLFCMYQSIMLIKISI